jgi:aminoglycoside 3-N-acetyltransferase
MVVSQIELDHAIQQLRLCDLPVMIHSSLRSFSEPVERGADGVIDSFLSCGCTIMVPTFTESYFSAAPPQHLRPSRNGVDYVALCSNFPEYSLGNVFHKGCRKIDDSMGALPRAVLRRVGVHRGLHPLNSFAAVGPLAAQLIVGQTPDDIYAPLRELAHLRGIVLLIGVGLNRMTILHLAEQLAGRRLFIRWAYELEGLTIAIEVGSCSEGFPNLARYVSGLGRTTVIYGSEWTAYPAWSILAVAAQAIEAQPTVTSCGQTTCLRCHDIILGGPLGTIPLGRAEAGGPNRQ